MENLKIIIFDVGDAFCALIRSPKGYGLMIDCGSSPDKTNPVDVIKKNRDWLEMRNYVTQSGDSYPLALLHITHPDDDHVRNAQFISKNLTPYLLRRVYTEHYDDSSSINSNYKTFLD